MHTCTLMARVGATNMLPRKEVNSTWKGCGGSKYVITIHKVQYSIIDFTRLEAIYIGVKTIIVDV